MRRGTTLSVIMLDIDRFKEINDTYGHPTGDQAIVALGVCLRQVIRESDVAGRIGGEEFALALPETDAEAAHLLAERLREEVERIEIQAGDAHLTFTVSLGVAKSDVGSTFERTMADADQALYSAKQRGRNQSVLYGGVN